MDRLAACHAMYGFLHMNNPHRGRHTSSPNCQNVKRSLSLTDRRGIISPGRGNGRGLISPLPPSGHGHRAKGASDDWEGMERMHGPRSHFRMHDFGLLMHALGSSAGQILLPTAMEFGRNRAHNKSFTYGRRRGSELWSVGEQLGQLLLSLRYSPADNQLWIGVLRASGIRAAAPYVTIWLIRQGQKPEKKSTPKPGDARRFSIAPVFDEVFSFEVVPSEVHNSTLVISVMNCGSGGDSDTEIGYSVLGELGADETGKTHWREALGQPGTIITQWHGLMAE